MSKLPNVSTPYGAPMGRAEKHQEPEGKLTVRQVHLDNGGYDSGGAYWGLPNNLHLVEDESGEYQAFERGTPTQVCQKLREEHPGIPVEVAYDLDTFVAAYLEVSRLSLDGGDYFGWKDFTKAAKSVALKDCKKFLEANQHLFGAASCAQAAFDFWLTRNHEGCGFWDRPELYGENSTRLTEAAEAFGEQHAYVSSRKKIGLE